MQFLKEWSFDQRILNTYILCDRQWSSSVVILPHDVLSGDKGSFVSHMFSAFPYEQRTSQTARGALDAAFKLTAKERFQSTDMADRSNRAMERVYDDEVLPPTPAPPAG